MGGGANENGNSYGISEPYGEEIPSTKTELEEPRSEGGPNDSIQIEGHRLFKVPTGYGKEIWGRKGLPADTQNGKWRNQYKIEIESVELLDKKNK